MVFVLSSAVIAALASLPTIVYGHGYMETPMARNLYAHYEGKSGNPTDVPAIPLYQTTPQGINRNNVVCGMDQGWPNNDYDEWLDTQGNVMPWISQGTYNKEDIIQINTKLTAHHKGHLEVKACAMGRESTQDCFDANPLVFVKDLLYGMPKDNTYPGRGYLNGLEYQLSMEFKLPGGLVGEQVLLQWVYWTANSCNPIGYKEYYATPKPVSPTGPNWSSGLDTCPPTSETPLAPIPNPALSGILTPEVFINCAEITVAGEQIPTPPVEAPIQSPVQPGSGTCGGGSVGDAICADPSLCCSKWGHCGTSDEHCNNVATGSPIAPTEAPVQSPIQSPVQPGSGTCGGGSVGDAICADPSLCCSKWGHCGTSDEHCNDIATGSPVAPTEAPIESPSPPVESPTDGSNHGGNSRMIAYLAGWKDCPTTQQLEEYTHIVIAFAISYDYQSSKNICSPTCEIKAPDVCGNAQRPDLIKEWRDMGKKVILSFGGAGMGGSWPASNNDCWDYCFGRETYVVERLTSLVNEMGFDGVDIDYEYYYEDNQNGSGFSKGAEAQTFLRDVTTGLRDSLPTGAELTHAPMEPDLMPGTGYFKVMQDVADKLDFLMPQYYNGYIRPYENFDGALDHFRTLTDTVFNGDASKVVFGFCINDCSSFNLDGVKSAKVMEWLAESYPCNGGAFFWVVHHDTGGDWSRQVNNQLSIDAGRCDSSSKPNTPAPVMSPTTPAPVTPAPVASPTSAPNQGNCVDDPNFTFRNTKDVTCEVVARTKNKKFCNKIAKSKSDKKVKDYCPFACGKCETCKDDKKFRHTHKTKKRNCKWIKKKEKKNSGSWCEKEVGLLKIKNFCPVTCYASCDDIQAIRK